MVVKTYGLTGEVRRDKEEGLMYEVKIKHNITLGSRELSFFFTYIIPPIHLSWSELYTK